MPGRLVRGRDVGIPLGHPLVALDDPPPDVGPAFVPDESLEGGADGVGLRLEPSPRDKRLELGGEAVWYANRNLYRHAKSIPLTVAL